MKILLVFLGLLGNSAAMPFQMYMPRMPGFSSKSEEMMRYGQFNYMHPPPMGPYGGGFQIPPPYPQYPMPPMWPLPSGWQNPPTPQHQTKADPTQETQKPNQTQPQKPSEQQPLNQPPQDPPKGKADTQPQQPFPPFNNGLFPYQQPPWPIPQRMPPPGFGRLPHSNEEGGNPYFGFFGYPGFGGRPYYSEEIEDYEKPKEEDPPKPEDPPPEPSANSTVPETNSTQPGGQGKNETSPTLNNVPGLNPGDNPTGQNGIFPLPRVNFSGQVVPRSQIPWKPSQPKIYGIYPNPNIRNSPSGRQSNPTDTATGQRQSGPFYQNQPGQRGQGNSFAWEGKQAARPRNPTYRKTYTPTSRVNYPNYAGNPANFRRKPQGPNKPFVGTSVTPLGPKQGTIGYNEKMQNPKGKSPGQKEKTVSPTKDTSGSWRNSQHYGVSKQNLGWPHPDGNMLGPNFNSVNQQENSYYSRGGSRRVPNSNAQTQSQNFPKGVALEPKRIPYETQTKQPELKHSTHQPIYPEVIPSPKREHFPDGRNSWSHQKIAPSFKEDPGNQEEHLSHLPPGSWGNVFYPEYNSYYPRENSPYTGSNTWDERVDSPNTMGHPKHPQYPLKTADHKNTGHYNEEDTPDPTGDEPFPGQSRWGEEELSFNGRPTSTNYDGGQYTSNQPKEYLPYYLDNPSKPREDHPYSEFYPWSLDETFPSYKPSPTTSPPMDSGGYYVNNAIQQEESTLFPLWNSWDQKTQAQGQQESEPYFNINNWDQATNVHKVSPPNQKENYPYSSNPLAGLQKNPTWQEGEDLNYDTQMTRLNSPERQNLAFLDFIPQSYLSGQTEAHLFHQSPQSSCCDGSSTGPKENPLALQVYTPSYNHIPGENQNISPTHTESSHTKYARPLVSSASILSSQRNNSENKLPGESQSPSTFRDDGSTLKNTPCSVNNQQGQVGIRSFPKASSPQSSNTPCLKNDLGGDRNNVLEQTFEDSHLTERTADLTLEQLVTGTADEGPKPEGIQNEIQVKEGEQQQQRPPSVLQVPCFGSQLTKLQSSSTRTPSSSGRQGPFDGDLTMPTENPNTFVGLATGEHFRSINIDQLDVDGHTPSETFQKGTDPQDQGQDCLLIQA